MGSKKINPMNKLLGEILLEKYMITGEQLKLALERQKKEYGKYLGEILLEMGILQDEIHKALDSHNKRKKIGEVLLDAKIITSGQLEEALKKQKEDKEKQKPLGKILLELGYINHEEYLQALAKHFTMKIISLQEFAPAQSLQKLVGENYALMKKIVVLQNGNGKIKLALPEPSLFLIQEMQKFLPEGKRMEFYLAKASEVEPLLGKIYPPTGSK
jgi:hypothetical protein